jgi:hypothetical protein
MLPDNPTTADYLVDIVRNQMSLANERVNVYNTKFSIPNDSHLFVAVEYKSSKTFASKSETAIDANIFNEHQVLNVQERYAIMVFSRNLEALQRKEEVVMALYSVYARQQSDKYGLKIARIAPIQDLSALEGAAILYRFEIDVVILRGYEKIPQVDWFGTFAGAVTAENGSDVTKNFTPTLPS